MIPLPCCYFLAMPLDEVEAVIFKHLPNRDARKLVAWLRAVRKQNGIPTEGM